MLSGEDCGQPLELWAKKAIECTNFGELFCGSLKDKTVERKSDGGVLGCDVPGESLRSKGCALLILVMVSWG